MKKNLKKHLTIIGIVFAVVMLLALLDIQGSKMWKDVDGVEWGESYSRGEESYMTLYWVFAYALAVVITLVSFIYRRDGSEAIAILTTFWIFISTGLEDIFFYVFKGLPLWGEKMGWLGSNKLVSIFSNMMGYEVITGTTLVISVGIGFVLVTLINYLLYNFNTR